MWQTPEKFMNNIAGQLIVWFVVAGLGYLINLLWEVFKRRKSGQFISPGNQSVPMVKYILSFTPLRNVLLAGSASVISTMIVLFTYYLFNLDFGNGSFKGDFGGLFISIFVSVIISIALFQFWETIASVLKGVLIGAGLFSIVALLGYLLYSGISRKAMVFTPCLGILILLIIIGVGSLLRSYFPSKNRRAK